VSERAVGKTVPCPGCNQHIEVLPPAPAESSREVIHVGPPASSGPEQDADPMVDSPPSLPPGMPPMPGGKSRGWRETPYTGPPNSHVDFLDGHVGQSAGRHRGSGFIDSLNLADLFFGKEKEDVFALIPGEQVLDEFTIRHQHLLIVQRGITRVTLTTHRVLYTVTRVFSPAYWLLAVLFPPLLLYYVFRITLNRNIAMPLTSIDSLEKHYRPNWLLFILASIAAFFATRILTFAVSTALDQQTPSIPLAWTIQSIMFGLAAPALLVLLLKTRIIAILVVSANNKFPIGFSSADKGFSEARLDVFIQRACAELHRAKRFLEEPKASES